MIQLDNELGRIQQLPSNERLRALKRIIPKKTARVIAPGMSKWVTC